MASMKTPMGKTILFAVAAHLAAVAALAFFGTGSVLTVADNGVATLVRKTFLGESSESFLWADVRHVRWTGSVNGYPSAGSRRGAAGENLALELASGNAVAVFSRSVAWPVGNLNRSRLTQHIGKELRGTHRSVSLGGASWFIAFILAGISAILLLLKMVHPISSSMSPGELRQARWFNLRRFLYLVFGALVLWAGILMALIFFLIGGLPI